MRGNTLLGKRKMFGWTVVAFIAAVIILCGTIHIFASSTDSKPYNKYYTSVRVEDGDTVWSIADRYITDSQVSKRDYVDEVCRLNSLTDGNVRSGDYLVVSDYSQDIKCCNLAKISCFLYNIGQMQRSRLYRYCIRFR